MNSLPPHKKLDFCEHFNIILALLMAICKGAQKSRIYACFLFPAYDL
jgi:hypothetical protein